MRDRGITHLATMLHANSTLTDLNLATDNIGKSGAGVLGEMLAVNASLVSLNLDGNSIGSEGASSIARALEHANTSLQSLSLDSTELSEDFYLALAQSLRSPSCPLRFLSASRNTAADKVALLRPHTSLCTGFSAHMRLAHVHSHSLARARATRGDAGSWIDQGRLFCAGS